jgi:BON domain
MKKMKLMEKFWARLALLALLLTLNVYANAQDLEDRLATADAELIKVNIINQVNSQLLANQATSGMNLNITMENNVVIIEGAVRSESEKKLAYSTVKNTTGIRSVRNNLTVGYPEKQNTLVHLAEQ